MVKLDTVKTIIPSLYCEDFSYYNQSRVDKDKRIAGIDNIKPDRFTGAAIVEFNSNIFPDSPQLVTIDNIHEAFNKLNESGLINLRAGALEESLITTLDATHDAKIANTSQTLRLLKACAYNPDFHKREYQRNDNSTFRYEKSDKGRSVIELKFYSKQNNYLRSEVRYSNSAAIKADFNVYSSDSFGRAKLIDVLASQENVVWKAFNRVAGNIYADTQTQKNIHEINMVTGKKTAFTNTLSGKDFDAFSTLEKYHFNLDNIYLAKKQQEPKSKSKSKILAPYTNVLQRFNLFNLSESADFNLLLELRQQLQNPLTETQSTYHYAAA